MMNTCTLSDPNDIKAHIQIIADLHTPVTIKSDAGFEVPNCRLLYQPCYPKHMFVRLSSQQCPDQGGIRIYYALHGVPYEFSCDIIGKAKAQQNITVLPTQLPKTIQSINRRVYIRTKFSLADPIGFDMTISNHNTIRLLAEDISAGGIGFFVPDHLNQIAMGGKYPIKFQLPGSGEIRTQIDVRNLRRFSRMHRIGARFVSLDVCHRMKILELVTQNETRKSLKNAEPGARQKARIFVDEHQVHQRIWPFLEACYEVRRGILKNQTFGQDGDAPEVILLNLDADGAIETLASTRKSACLKSLPLILVSARYAAPPFDMPEVQFVRSSAKQEELINIIDRMVYEYRWSRKVCELTVDCKPAPKVLLLDRSNALHPQIIAALERRPFEIITIADDKDLINRFAQIEPDVILLIHADDGNREAALCKLMNFNKKLKPKPKILATADKAVADDLKAQRLVIETVSLPVEPETLIQTIESLRL